MDGAEAPGKCQGYDGECLRSRELTWSPLFALWLCPACLSHYTCDEIWGR